MKRASFLSILVCASAILVSARAAGAQCLAPPSVEAPAETGAAAVSAAGTTDQTVVAGPVVQDHTLRVVAPVTIGGRGPFRFIIDTGANRSVVSQPLADSLGLAPHSTGAVHSIQGVTTAPLVEVSDFSYGRLNLPSAPMPVLRGAVFAGEQGLLGVDGMEGRRLRIDFEHGCVEIRPSANAPRLAGWQTIRGRLAFGRLVVVPGTIAGARINVIIDTGSDSSLANIALRQALREHFAARLTAVDQARVYTAGLPIVLDSVIATPRMRLGDLEVDHILAYVGDFHIFELWGLQNEPTLLLGMDVLSQTRGMAIDYARGTVQFQTLTDPHSVQLNLRYNSSRLNN